MTNARSEDLNRQHQPESTPWTGLAPSDAATSTHSFAIVHTWPDLKNAEYEVLQRVLQAARRVGAHPIVIDRNGKILWATAGLGLCEGTTLDPRAVDFVLALHFDSGRVWDAYSYITLWQPIEFYHAFGYQKSIDKVTSYNDFVSCDSDLADAHGINLLTGVGRAPSAPLPKMFHSLPEPFLKPLIKADSTLFYIGINWERVGRPKGRFHDALIKLDDKTLTDIYGPELLMGVAPWEGFKTYRGELPFDGEAVKNAINRSGVCLVLSSAAHQSAGIMSNRLFEGLAGGAAIIATPHPLIDKYFSEVVYLVDDAKGETHLYQQIVEKLRYIRSHLDEATQRTLEGQRILKEKCSLEASIALLIADHPRRQMYFEDTFLAYADVSVILTYEDQDIDAFMRAIAQFANQKRAKVSLHVVCDSNFASRHSATLKTAAVGSLAKIVLHPANIHRSTPVFDGLRPDRARTGPMVAEALRQIDTDLFAFSTIDDTVFSDHFASVARVLAEQPAAKSACVGMISHRLDATRSETREIDSLRFVDLDSIALVNGIGQVGRFVYRSSLLNGPFSSLMQMLDGEEHSYFRLAAYLQGPLAQTNYCTYVWREPSLALFAERSQPVEHQRQYIRDLFARNPAWLERLSRGTKIPEFVYAYSPGAPIRWQNYVAPIGTKHIIPVDTPLDIGEGGAGMTFLRGGFSYPERGGVWIEAERATIEFSLPLEEINFAVDYELVLVAHGRRSVGEGRNQHVAIVVNGMTVAYDQAPDRDTSLRFRLPRFMLAGNRNFKIEIVPDHSEMVYDAAGEVIDPRRLSLLLKSISVVRLLAIDLVMLLVDTLYSTGRGDKGAAALVSGFHAHEANLTWIAGKMGRVLFSIDRVPEEPRLHLKARGRRSLETGNSLIMTLSVNGTPAGVYELGENDQTIIVDLTAIDLRGLRIDLLIEASHAEPVYDENETVIDNRLLGVAISAIGILDLTDKGEGPGAKHRQVVGRVSAAKLIRLLGWRS